MKTLKNSLAIFALVFAFGAVYALDVGINAEYSVNGQCIVGETDQMNCSPTNTGPLCTITVLGIPYPAFVRGTNCTVALRQP